MQEKLLHAFENYFESVVHHKVAFSEPWLLSAVQHSGKAQFMTKYECVSNSVSDETLEHLRILKRNNFT